MKTIKEWFESVKDEKIRMELLENMLLVCKDNYTKSLEIAIRSGTEYLDNVQELAERASLNLIDMHQDNTKSLEIALDKKITGLIKRIEELEKIAKAPEPERKIVFEYEIIQSGQTIKTYTIPRKEVELICQICFEKYIFKQWERGTPCFYIGHYE